MINRFSSYLAHRFPALKAPIVYYRARRRRVAAAVIVIAHVIGALTSVHAVMENRTSQGAIAWAISLNTFPYLAVPAYWIFGDTDFDDYISARRSSFSEVRPAIDPLLDSLKQSGLVVENDDPRPRLLEKVAGLPLTNGNAVRLLIDGEETFDAIFADIESARQYILLQFFIIRDDNLGQRLKDALARKVSEGVRAYVLYDGLGSRGLSQTYLEELRDAGVKVTRFIPAGSDATPYRINFRNHRKIVVVDGKSAFVGGHNVGDEYMGRDDRFSSWRDTHVRVAGPAAQCLQVSFVEDWHWATGEVITDLLWTAERAGDAADVKAISVPSGPADPHETCSILFLSAINHAEERVWIASPYFVADSPIVTALKMAAMRGVDVRLILADETDSLLVHYASFAHLTELEDAGVKVLRYKDGFLHQKVVLADHDFAAIGSANFDNRSFRLNFEITLAVFDHDFAEEVEAMLATDLTKCEGITGESIRNRPFLFHLVVRLANLFSPIL